MGVERMTVSSECSSVPPERESVPPERESAPDNSKTGRISLRQISLGQDFSVDAPFSSFQIAQRLNIVNALGGSFHDNSRPAVAPLIFACRFKLCG
jgi:hypothetical protein